MFQSARFFEKYISTPGQQKGESAEAAKSYERFLDIWKDADPGIPEVEDARKRLTSLKKQ
jgi:hypothetical protein